MDFVLIDLLVIQGSLLQHAVAELYDGCGAKPMEGGDGSVARDPIGDGSARYRNAMFRRDAARAVTLLFAFVLVTGA